MKLILVSTLPILFFVGCNYKSSSGASATPAAITGVTIISGAATQGSMAFSPNPYTVKVGTSVQWTNSDNNNHTVTSDNSTFASGQLYNGNTFSFTFQTAGTYTYHCSVHPSMTGTIIVQ